MKHCQHAVGLEQWVDYFAGDLDAVDSERLDELLFVCDSCAEAAERCAAVTGGAALAVPAVISPERLAIFEARQEPMTFNPMRPNGRARAGFPEHGFLLIHRLGGMRLDDADRVDLIALGVDGSVMFRLDDVAFDPDRGEVLVACQRHLAGSFDPDMVFRVEAHVGSDVREEGAYHIEHILDA